MFSNSKSTSLYTILSSDHGRLRREQRDIDKRDLCKALKYGSFNRVWQGRWQVEYDGLTFILDRDRRREITCFPSPLTMASVSYEEKRNHMNAKHVLEQKTELCVSHTVLVVDNSGSMTEHDIHLHRDRQTAAYTVSALEFVAEQLFNQTANNSDVVSLIEFRDTACLIFEREPVSWELYNKLLARRDVRTFVAREGAMMSDMYGCDSNYLPALDEAERLLMRGYHENCALSLFFLSDGAPSDAKKLGLTPAAAKRRMSDRMVHIAANFNEQLKVAMVGFGNSSHDFSTLEDMVKAVNEAPGDAKAEFLYCAKLANEIGTAITSLVSSTVETKTAFQGGGRRGKTIRNVSSEADTNVFNDWKYFQILGHYDYSPRQDSFIRHAGLPPGAVDESNKQLARKRLANLPPILAINTSHCGKGVERLAFRCNLSYKGRPDSFVLNTMVAKETLLVERIEENIEFHKGFCETQSLAAFFAGEFNRRLRSLPNFNETTTPQIEFLQCSVLILADNDWQTGERGVLVERMLDTNRFEWRKWNNNAGSVDGKLAHFAIDVDREMAKLNAPKIPVPLGAIAEGDSDEESEAQDEDSVDDAYNAADMKVGINPSDYLQAFTHFTHHYSNRRAMVCDLQGVYNTGKIPPTFELSDPAIHYSSKRGRKMVFGCTDHGHKGMKLFFKTHKCTDVCKVVLLGRRNTSWNKDWRASSMKPTERAGAAGLRPQAMP
jgi:hypothetical protein